MSSRFASASILYLTLMPLKPLRTSLSMPDFARYLMVLARTAIPWSLVGFPAISVPCGVDAQGLPIGVQLVAPPHHEATLVTVAAAVEDATLDGGGPR